MYHQHKVTARSLSGYLFRRSRTFLRSTCTASFEFSSLSTTKVGDIVQAEKLHRREAGEKVGHLLQDRVMYHFG